MTPSERSTPAPYFPVASRPLLLVNRITEKKFRTGQEKVERLPCPVISVGNLTSGGTGKSPVVQYLAHHFSVSVRRPAIVLRGMGDKSRIISTGIGAASTLLAEQIATASLETGEVASQGYGDEALMHARLAPLVPVITGRDRVASGIIAIEDLHCDLMILDDGFQYWRLRRDVDIVLLDGNWLFGERAPRHFPRESFDALERAHVIAVSKTEKMSDPQQEGVLKFLQSHARADAIIGSLTFLVDGFFDAVTGVPATLDEGEPIVAFSGIADPDRFFQDLRDQSVKVVEAIAFRDHHEYKTPDIDRMNASAKQHSASCFVTTEKDAVKLDQDAFEKPLLTLRVNAILEPEETILEFLESRIDAS